MTMRQKVIAILLASTAVAAAITFAIYPIVADYLHASQSKSAFLDCVGLPASIPDACEVEVLINVRRSGGDTVVAQKSIEDTRKRYNLTQHVSKQKLTAKIVIDAYAACQTTPARPGDYSCSIKVRDLADSIGLQADLTRALLVNLHQRSVAQGAVLSSQKQPQTQ